MLASARRLFWRFGLLVGATMLLLRLEALRMLRAAGAEIAGPWEEGLLRLGMPALGLLAAVPVIALVVAYGALVPIVRQQRGRIAWSVAGALIAGTLAIDLSTGRKAHVLSMRIPFVLGLAAIAAAGAYFVLPPSYALVRRRPWIAPVLGGVVMIGAMAADERILPRLYLPFHLALLALVIVGLALFVEGLVALSPRGRWAPFVLDALAFVGAWQIVTSTGRMRWAGEGLARFENARRIVEDHSLTYGRVASLAARRWPPPPLDLGEGGVDPLVEDESRSLDATGRDVLLVTIDALRADHCGAYGYPRPTTPALDALAKEGVVFEHAYTPAPHTSYAVSSLMTGKYLRPIMALEAVAGGGRRLDETWALLLRGYGFRTAAFYPPAVFFVDAERFSGLAQRGLDFEYSKIEFAAPSLRVTQLADWLKSAPEDKRLFAWVHLFEPHEPYVTHPEHPFGDAEIDRYDSEIATADEGLGGLVRAFRAARPSAIVIVTADHGEAFGEHGARYHGTTVFEEQVHVPLVISAPGLVAARRVARPVQLVDLLPTVLSAYGIPRPPRVRGRDLGSLLGPVEPQAGDGIAFAEVDDAAMLAEANRRLVCNRKNATCALYDVSTDPEELHPIVADEQIATMRRTMGALIAASAKLEGFAAGDASTWPDSLRRALSGEADAAIEVAPLLDDVDVNFRRRAAEALARLGRSETAVHVARAIVHEIDEPTRRWLTIARVRTVAAPGETPVSPDIEAALVALVESNERDLSRYAALAIGEGMARRTIDVPVPAQVRAFLVLVDWLPRARVDAELARSILGALVTLHTRDLAPRATKALLDALDDIRLRTDAARALGALGDPAATAGLVAQLRRERHTDARAVECLALARVAERSIAMPWFAWILGVPEPAPGGARALTEALAPGAAPPWTAMYEVKATHVKAELAVMPGSHHRLVVDVPPGTTVRMRLWNAPPIEAVATEAGAVFELGERMRENGAMRAAFEVETTNVPIGVVALVRLVDDLPPPKPDRSTEDDGEE